MPSPTGVGRRNLVSSSFKQYAFRATGNTALTYTEFVFINQADGSADDTKNFMSSYIRLINNGGIDLEYSFDGVNSHGILIGGSSIGDERREYSIFVRRPVGFAATAFVLEVW